MGFSRIQMFDVRRSRFLTSQSVMYRTQFISFATDIYRYIHFRVYGIKKNSFVNMSRMTIVRNKICTYFFFGPQQP